jgi:molybdate transport system substrate-binding protein
MMKKLRKGFKMVVKVLHADSLAGPVGELKRCFEKKFPNVEISAVSGRSRELAERIVAGDVCDVFAPSDPAVLQEMIAVKVGNRAAVSWYIVFSSNELVVVTAKGNPRGIHGMADLARVGIRLARVTGLKDMAAGRTVEFVRRAATAEESPELMQDILDGAIGENTIPDVLTAVCSGKVDAGIVYLSAAVSVASMLDIVSFPSSVNLSEDIRNAVTIPVSSQNETAAADFIRFLLSEEGREILKKTGQPPLIPPVARGEVPGAIAAFL